MWGVDCVEFRVSCVGFGYMGFSVWCFVNPVESLQGLESAPWRF